MRPIRRADAPPELNLKDVVRRTVEVVLRQTIDIPRIAVVPQGEVTSGFTPFTLDVAGLHLQPKHRSRVGQTLRTHEQFTLSAQSGERERRLENYIVHTLIDFDDIATAPTPACCMTCPGRWWRTFRATSKTPLTCAMCLSWTGN